MTLKVLHLIDSGGLYGAETMLLNLVEEQIKSGLKPLILSAGTPGISEKPLEKEALKRGLPVKIVRSSLVNSFVTAYRLNAFAKDNKFNILHSHGYKFNILFGILPRPIRAAPLVATLHGYVCASRFSKLHIYQIIESFILPYLDGVVFVSDAIRKNPLLANVKYRNEATILNGINPHEVIRQAKCDNAISIKDIFQNYDANNVYLGAIGRLSQEKGFLLLVEVFAELVRNYSSVYLVFIGDGDLRSSLEAKVKSLGLSTRVKFTGFINQPYRLIGELDGVVMPSLSEGLPMTVLEACVLRRRVVATNVGSISEVLEDYGPAVVVKPGNSNELKAAIENCIIKNSKTENHPAAKLSDRFLSSKMAEKYTTFYEKVFQN